MKFIGPKYPLTKEQSDKVEKAIQALKNGKIIEIENTKYKYMIVTPKRGRSKKMIRSLEQFNDSWIFPKVPWDTPEDMRGFLGSCVQKGMLKMEE